MLLPLLSLTLPLWQDDPERGLRDRDAEVRLAAAHAIADGALEDDDARKALERALEDDDWEVAEIVATALGHRGSERSVGPLADVVQDGPIARVRRAAAASLALLDAQEGFDELEKKCAGRDGLRACEGIVYLAPALTETQDSRNLERAASRAKEPEHRAAAVRALLAVGEDRAELYADLDEPDAWILSAALDGVVLAPRAEDWVWLTALIGRGADIPVVQRRARWAARATLAQVAEGERGALANALAEVAENERGAQQLAQLLGELCTGVRAPLDGAQVTRALAPFVEHASEDVRAMAVRSLEHAATSSALGQLRELGADDTSQRVRIAAVLAIRRAGDVEGEEADRDFLIERLSSDEDSRVREEAAVGLGVRGLESALAPLSDALHEPAWEVVVCAAVSLGRTRLEDAVAPLVEMYENTQDWKLRGAAIEGLGRLREKSAVPVLIAALGAEEPVIVRTAHAHLTEIARSRPMPAEVAVWEQWWSENEVRIKLRDPEDERARAERYGYGASTQSLYEGLDVVVLESRGDHMQEVLDHLGIGHRRTMATQVPADGLPPMGVFAANCTGEIEPDDVEQLAWFVRSGGALFSSCWAVHHTVARVYPGVVDKLDTLGEVLDDVSATSCAPGHPLLIGVFDDGVVPMYSLEGAYLIDVLAPERVQVLVDSPECASRWGGGQLAAWFSVGHGTIFDSANHFEEQGFTRATHLREPEERQAFAIDHLGMTYAELRSVMEERWWENATEVGKRVRDLSVFRLVSNFVREKRLAGD